MQSSRTLLLPKMPDKIENLSQVEELLRAIMEELQRGQGNIWVDLRKIEIGSSGGMPFCARVTSGSGSDDRWDYTFVEQSKGTAGYGGWVSKQGGQSGSAYNLTENMNSASGGALLGIGVTRDDLQPADDTFCAEVQPAPTETLVWMHAVALSGGGTEYWFQYENGVTVNCGACV